MKAATYCHHCKQDVEFEMRKKKWIQRIQGKDYEFEVEFAYCLQCGEEVYFYGFWDRLNQCIDTQYRSFENIITIEEMQHLMDLYDIGKGPLGLALGFGEVTMKRYMSGDYMPSKEHSDIIRRALEDPVYMKELLEKNKGKLKATAYSKAMAAAADMVNLTDLPSTLLATVSYLLEQLEELSFQHLMLLLSFTQDDLYPKESLLKLEIFMKTFHYALKEDPRYAIIKNKHRRLTQEQKEKIDAIIKSYGRYSYTSLKQLTSQ